MAFDAGALIGGGLSAGGGLVSGLAQARAMKKIAKKQMKQQRLIHEASAAEREALSQATRADQEIARQNLLAGETARLNVLSSLGQPGTYGPGPGSTSGPLSLGVFQPTGISAYEQGPGGLLGTEVTKRGLVTGKDVALKGKPTWKGTRTWEATGTLLDPEAMAAQVKGTAAFRTVSGMVAEAEQLMNREGPLWDQLNNSIVGGIYEQNAAFQRDAMEQLSRSIARGGSARRAGLQMAQAFQIQEQVNRNRTNQLWQAKMNLEEYRTTYAQQVTDFAQNWVNNASGIRDNFTNALSNLQTFWASTMAPTLAGATVSAQSATQQGMLNASQGLMDAVSVKGQAISGAIEGIIGLGKQALSSISIPGLSTSQISSGGPELLPSGGAVVFSQY